MKYFNKESYSNGLFCTLIKLFLFFSYLHLLLQNQSIILEDMVYRLDACTAYLLNKYGEEIYTQYTELNLMADLVIDIYATAAMLGR